MSPANDTKVIIGGNVYTLSGNESEEYIQRVALYINNKLEKIKMTDNAKQLNTRLLSVLLDINIADDYFKAKEQIKELEGIIKSKDEIAASLEQDTIKLQKQLKERDIEKYDLNKKIEELKEEMKAYKTELDEYIEIFNQDT